MAVADRGLAGSHPSAAGEPEPGPGVRAGGLGSSPSAYGGPIYLYLVLPMATGFMIVGPILAIAFYEISRRLAAGEPISFAVALRHFAATRGKLP